MTDQSQVQEPRYQPRQAYAPTLSERLAGAARAQPAGLLLLVAGTSLLLSGMRPTSRDTMRRARTSVRRIAQGDFSPVRETAGDLASGVRDQVSGLGDTASEFARSATESVSGLADDAQQALRNRTQQLVDTTRSSAQFGMSFVLEDQPLLLAAIGLAAGATLGAIIPATPQENRLMGEARDRVAELATETARQKLGELGDAASEATERLKNAVKERASQATEDLDEVARDVVEPFANVASSGSSVSGGKSGQGSTASGGSQGQTSGGSVGKIS